jgi:predicted acylesterase/phospholipase RssA
VRGAVSPPTARRPVRRKIPGMAAASTCATAPTAFVLAGGGSLGAVQTGMLAELVAAGERPDMIVGVSAGALNGGFFAYESGITMIEKMHSLWCAITTR